MFLKFLTIILIFLIIWKLWRPKIENYSSGGLRTPGDLPPWAAADLFGDDVFNGDIGGGIYAQPDGTYSLYYR